MDLHKITQVLRETAGFDGDIFEETELTSLGLDSLDTINFFFDVEQESGVKIPDEAIINGKIKTIKCLIEYINNENSA